MVTLVKVHFPLVQDENGDPPVGAESVWAAPTDRLGEFVLDNVPFFVREATLGDRVSASMRDGVHWFDRLLQRSSNSLIRIVFYDDAQRDRVIRDVERLGCSTEFLSAYGLVAVNVPATASLESVQDYLQHEAAADHLDYEEPILRQ